VAATEGRPAPAITPDRPARRLAFSERTNPFDASTHHTADPCTALEEPIVPSTFEQVTTGNITIAWESKELESPYEAPLRPIALAHAVAGALEEAAVLTGTDRREKLTVIVYAGTKDFQERMKAPAWVGGLYDGAAVHLVANLRADVGVVMADLRHEVMHAQIHAAIGCVPFWFNEGLANYLAGMTSPREWAAMVRTGEPFDLRLLRDPEVFEVKTETAARMYGVSTAMIAFLVHRGGEVALREAVRIAQSADSRERALDLWQQIAPNVDYRAILDDVAQHVFGVPLGAELDTMMKGQVCCTNLRSVAELKCVALGVLPTKACRPL
jgi:hypothetical protein